MTMPPSKSCSLRKWQRGIGPRMHFLKYILPWVNQHYGRANGIIVMASDRSAEEQL